MVIRSLIILLFMSIMVACGQGDQAKFDLETEAEKWNSTAKAWDENQLKALYEGELLYQKTCSVCHGRGGVGDMQIGAPALKESAGAMKVKALISTVLLGRKNSMMPAFSASLTDKEISSIASYVRNAWGNNTGKLILESEVASLR